MSEENRDSPIEDVQSPSVDSKVHNEEETHATDEGADNGVDFNSLSEVEKKCALGDLVPASDGSGMVYRRMEIGNSGLTNLDGLSKFRYIQYLHLSGNKLRDASALSELPDLVKVDLSNNLLVDAVDFVLMHLEELDLSNNCIETLGNLGNIKYLGILYVNDNKLKSLDGLRDLPHVKEVYARSNMIETVSGLDCPSLRHLDISSNQVANLSGVVHLEALCELIASHNKIDDIEGGQMFPSLQMLDISNNALCDFMTTTDMLAAFPSLINLNCSGNRMFSEPGEKISHPTSVMLMKMPSLVELNGEPVSPEEKVAAAEAHGLYDEEYQQIRATILPPKVAKEQPA